MMLDGATLVVSPLIALMKDQVDALRARGLASHLHQQLDLRATSSTPASTRCAAASSSLVYIAPERFRSSRFRRALAAIEHLAVRGGRSALHLQWGHDFRPDYLRLEARHRSLGSRLQTVALTATATP